MADRSFTGNECWVYGANAVDQLAGHHATLIADALGVQEPATCLVYSPRRGAEAGPFGLQAPSGSHALAVTGTRFITTYDSHCPGKAPEVRSAPFDNVLTVVIGEALTLGWFAVRSVQRGRPTTETIAFSSHGIEHFRAAVRAWRRTTFVSGADNGEGLRAHSLASQIPPFLWSQLAPLVLADEPLFAAVHGRETWLPSRSRRWRCTSPWACCLVTGGGLLIGQSEAPLEPGGLVFGVNVTCVDQRAIHRISLAPIAGNGDSGTTLAVEIRAGHATQDVSIQLGGMSPAGIRESLAHVSSRVEVAR
jgi:hypothetical protein